MPIRSLLLVVFLAPVATAQSPGTTVSGVVRDSLARRPLSGAIVQLVTADSFPHFARAALSDSLGGFTLDHVPDGRYTLGFFHPLLDSLGLEPMLREVRVNAHQPVRADLAVPSPARLRAAICKAPAARGASTGMVVGTVRAVRDGAPVAGVTLTAEWLEVAFSRNGVEHRVPRLVTTSAANGWFALCGVPNVGALLLTASRGTDSTDVIQVHVPDGGFIRRELYLGSAPSAGDGRLAGTVTSAAAGLPLEGAHVSVRGGTQTRTNERGEWTLVGTPMGTRMLEVRAIGYYPERRQVDVVAGAAPVRVVLSTLEAVLDTVKVTASRRMRHDLDGFNDRMRNGIGRYLLPADIERRHLLATSELFRNTPGMRMEGPNGFEGSFQMRGPSGNWCSPAMFIDGLFMGTLTPDELDTWMRPHNIAGIEIYAGAVPVQYQATPAEFAGRSTPACGSILIWKK